jgi:hypothetical protein
MEYLKIPCTDYTSIRGIFIWLIFYVPHCDIFLHNVS